MIVHHPYKSLTILQNNFNLSQEEAALAWSIVNDTYMTDMPLMFAPHTIALMSILLALVLRPNTTGIQSAAGSANNIATAAQAALSAVGQPRNPSEKQGNPSKLKKLATWLAESNVDIESIVDSTQEIISFYEVQEQYNEKLTREQINRFVKARGLDK